MKVGDNFPGFNISAKGLSIQRKKMNIIAENIANADTLRTENGKPYQRKFLLVEQNQQMNKTNLKLLNNNLRLNTTNQNHISLPGSVVTGPFTTPDGLTSSENTDKTQGEIVHMPSHPYADENGYVEMTNVNVITEMVEMIAATRSYEANLTALNASKQIAKDSLEI